MRERLVELLRAIDKDAIITCPRYSSESTLEDCKGCQYDKEDGSCDYVEREADYLLDDGWMRPPCKVGQTVYCIVDGIPKVMEGRVRAIWILEDGSQKLDTLIKGYFPQRYIPEDFGKTVFLTREEAKMKGGAE